ncbi:hypothetical protein WJ36_09740 [Burkholderia ubonensis]|nr:hypothetical protein WJ36_09740 [Burkholderia ubonensis]
MSENADAVMPISQEESLQRFRDGAFAIFMEGLDDDLWQLGVCAYEYGLWWGFYGRRSAEVAGYRSRLLDAWAGARRVTRIELRFLGRLAWAAMRCGQCHGC